MIFQKTQKQIEKEKRMALQLSEELSLIKPSPITHTSNASATDSRLSLNESDSQQNKRTKDKRESGQGNDNS
jgi:hypothetical protein